MAWLSRDIEKKLEHDLQEAAQPYPGGKVPADEIITDRDTKRN